MKLDVNVEEVGKRAKYLYLNGYSCSEALVSTIIEKFELDVPQSVVKMATGLAGGIGKTGEACGALTGGVMALGILFGRDHIEENPIGDQTFAKELLEYFVENNSFNSLKCQVLTEGFDTDEGEHKQHCSEFVAMIAEKASHMIIDRLK